MKLRDGMLWMVVVVATGFAGCAVCDTCDDFPGPCTGPNCGQNGLPPYMTNAAQGPAVMGSSTPPMDDSAGPAPTMPPGAPMAAPSAPPVDPTSPPAAMEPAPR